jgi:hypothetical protein
LEEARSVCPLLSLVPPPHVLRRSSPCG